jgi:hypothetical protein
MDSMVVMKTLIRCAGVRAQKNETGGMRRVHLRGHTNILKRILVHASGFNLWILMRRLIGVGTPRSLQGRLAAPRWSSVSGTGWAPQWPLARDDRVIVVTRSRARTRIALFTRLLKIGTSTTAC